MKLIICHQAKNPCYIKAEPMTPKGIVVHSTGANNPNLKRYVDCEAELGKNQYGNTGIRVARKRWYMPSSARTKTGM